MNTKVTEMETEEIKKELQDDQRSNVNENEGEQPEQLYTMNAGVRKQNLAPKTGEDIENHQQRNNISKLQEKIESACYQVTQMEITKRMPKLQSMFK